MSSAVGMLVMTCSQIDSYRGNRKVTFSVGDQVLVKLYSQQKQYWSRGVIIKSVGKTVYLVQLTESGQIIKRHANQLLKYRGREDKSCEKIVPAFILPTHPTSTDQLQPEVSAEESAAQPETTSGLVHGDISTEEEATLATPSIEPEPDPRSKRNRPVVDYKKFF
ncbi:uncharacterized protein LOC113507291 [Trichoplusia ni]|uniref:Uncharacterized protein LOC113493200 n=1 Tax=Trichoplusia ni TaxID=7111 RepID=A0A7E5W817_TRINI|nr:uncharacterized protein LOC113493200 [Trichoplusia ni]XP_026728516.1 uncharacterized protein LOC113494398 [Trichoplusia ni]XP_026736823.1 uncharacterized protein LOC113500297 [Trichoplusia ni]XP_026745152.1 uncharacterized protein LOC113506515 [Trichoplusia ni]XP_026745219.1 uncharacterized protein LOC113506582 [Trichoplusia ni]XP_026745953.1 uncharacterized protein LOC113507291 [Trichoplusia ni]